LPSANDGGQGLVGLAPDRREDVLELCGLCGNYSWERRAWWPVPVSRLTRRGPSLWDHGTVRVHARR
jgi:hypothetical protein